MTRLERYTFVPEQKGETVLEGVPASVVTGTTREMDTVHFTAIWRWIRTSIILGPFSLSTYDFVHCCSQSMMA